MPGQANTFSTSTLAPSRNENSGTLSNSTPKWNGTPCEETRISGNRQTAVTYSAPYGQSFVRGLEPVAASAVQIKTFVLQVLAETGAAKVDIIGHSEGGFQSLYVTKTQGIADKIAKVVAIAPPTHGTTFAGLYNLAYLLGQAERALVGQVLTTFGCPACSDLGIGGSCLLASASFDSILSTTVIELSR